MSSSSAPLPIPEGPGSVSGAPNLPDLGDEHRDLLGSPVLGEHARLLRSQRRDGPAAVSVFPRELDQAPRSWIEHAYPNVIDFNELDRGNRFCGLA
jgi:hypothetical protein